MVASSALRERTDFTVVAVTAKVNEMLAARFSEETAGDGELRVDFAARRIAGSIDDLRHLRVRAKQVNATNEFIALIDAVIADAQAAVARAPQPTVNQRSGNPVPATWATALIERQAVELPDFLKGI